MSAGDAALPTLTRDELHRYGRHLTLPDVGLEGQRRLKAARILVIGVGGLGSPVALYLAAAGVGTLGLADFDVVDVTNLQRQVAHGTADIGRPKLHSARDRIADLNPHVQVVAHGERLTSANALDVLRGYDVVVDGTDNFATRYLVSDACVLLGIPNVYGSIFRFEGQASVFSTPDGPCYRCLFPEPPPPDSVPNCAEGGVLGVLPGLVGTIQATEAIKLVLGIGRTLAGRLLLIDALTMEHRAVHIERDPECPACGTRTLTALVDYEEFCGGTERGRSGDGAGTDRGRSGDGPGTERGRSGDGPGTDPGPSHPRPGPVPDITPEALAGLLAHGDVDLVDVREGWEWDAGHVPGARHLPLGEVAGALDTFDRERDVVVMCQSGGRSATAARLLRDAGFTRVHNLAGGMGRWREDPSRGETTG